MKLNAILTSSVVRHFPNAALPEAKLSSVDAAINEKFSFQAAIHADEAAMVKASVEGPAGWNIRIRRVGLVTVPHHNTPVLQNPLDCDGLGHIPGYIPDPLFDEDTIALPQEETHAFWFSVSPAEKTAPGRYSLTIRLVCLDGEGKETGKPKLLKLGVRIRDVVIAPRKDFDVTHWFYSDCLITWYKTDMFDEKFWKLFEAYATDIAAHGQNVIYVPLFTPPLDSDKHPSQLLKITKDAEKGYLFDWSDVRRYVRTAKKCGITTFEWCHLFAQWGCRFALKIFEGQGADEKLLWPVDTPATSDIYRDFLSKLLPELKKFLTKEGILESSLFHVSDEPHGDEAKANYKAANEMLHSIAPWIRCIDAVSQIEFGKEKIIDVPVPSVSTALTFYNEGIESWCYYCCGPRAEYINHLMDTPLAKIAMHGFLFYRWPFKGFLHWGFNYWNKSQTRNLIDPFAVSDGGAWPGWAYGDTFLVYPGEKGPVDSARWEIFAESLQDYALLQTACLDRESKLISDVKSFSDFPKNPDWRRAAKLKLYAMIEKKAKGK